ncbi:MAG: hypothetical protein GXP63_02400 [DPANN group archaeon]|nr:hypothetical protein [DPANN group archaeon]
MLPASYRERSSSSSATRIYNDLLFTLNQYALQTGFVQNIIIRGEEWLKNPFIG